jgi:2-succinyl-5-enolpyruvyl-6-hydroxy-3-cyclohexene-1-carboxylate synthase
MIPQIAKIVLSCVPLIVVILQLFTKRKVNEIHVLVNSEHAALVKSLAEANATLVTANAMIVRLISALPERALLTPNVEDTST